jgi:hypothetical protein
LKINFWIRGKMGWDVFWLGTFSILFPAKLMGRVHTNMFWNKVKPAFIGYFVENWNHHRWAFILFCFMNIIFQWWANSILHSSPLIEPHRHWRNFQERAPLLWLVCYRRKASLQTMVPNNIIIALLDHLFLILFFWTAWVL